MANNQQIIQALQGLQGTMMQLASGQQKTAHEGVDQTKSANMGIVTEVSYGKYLDMFSQMNTSEIV